MTETLDQSITTTTQAEVENKTPDWYQTWRDRIHDWIQGNNDPLIADIVLFVPDMLMLTVRLIKDKRVPFLLKAQLVLSAAYVLSPFDVIPEGLSGVIGLVDDAGVLALTLYWLRNIVGIDPNILKENWVGENDLNDVIQQVHQRVNDNANKLFSGDVWSSIQKKFDKSESTSDQKSEPVESDSEQMGNQKIPINIDFN